MALIIDPDYNLFIQIMFVFWIVKSILDIICGIAQTKRFHSDKHGVVDIISGTITLLLSMWILI